MSGTEQGSPPLPARARKLRDGFILALCAAVLAIAGGANRSSLHVASVPPAALSSVSVPPLPPPLPSGAASGAPGWSLEDEAGCHFVDRGFGDYERWRPLPLGRVLVPRGHGVDADGGFDLLVHFHGAEAVRKQLAPEPLDLVIAGVDAGTMSGSYTRALADPGAWRVLVASIEQEVARTVGVPVARARRIALSSWSAGYGAIAQILTQPEERASAVVLLDSLHAGYAPGKARLESGQLSRFVEAARAATRGGPLFYLTHTEIRTDGYASTSETASFLLGELGSSPVAVHPGDYEESSGSMRLTRMLDNGRLFVRGYAGLGKDDHCAQLHLLPGILYEHVIPALQSEKRP